MSIAEQFVTQLNSEHCSVLSGFLLGQTSTIRMLGGIIVSFFALRIFNNLLFDPALSRLKKRLWKEQDD